MIFSFAQNKFFFLQNLMDTMKTSQYLETIATFLSSKSCESSKKIQCV